MPNLRFPGFAGEWRKERLGKACVINPSNDHLPNSFTYIDLESVVNGRLLKKTIISKREAPSRAQRILKREDILFQMVRPYQKNNYYFDLDGNYVASTGYAQIRTKHNPQFVFQYLHQQQFVDKVIKRCTGTSYPAINSTDLSNISISMPLLDEQEKVGSLLSRIDQRIDTQSQIIKNLQSLSKGMAQKLFSQQIHLNQNKESTPQLWNIIRLEELIIKTGRKNKDNIQYPIYSINNKEGFLPQNEQFEGVNSSDRGYDISLYKIVNKNTFAYNPARINVGSIGYSGSLDSIIISSLYVCFKTKKTLLDDYLLHYLRTYEFNKNVLRYSEGGVRQYLFFENLKKIKIPLPSLEEQQKIAKTLSSLDKKIEIETKLLEQLTNQKQYLLQNLFI